MPAKKRGELVPQNGKLSETKKAVAGLLVKLSKVAQSIARAKTPEEAILARDQAEVFRVLARCAHLGLESQNMAAQLRMLAEMQVGKMLEVLALHGGDRKSKTRRNQLRLDDFGINRNESKRFQKLAAHSDVVLDGYAQWANAQYVEATTAGFLRWAAGMHGKSNGRERNSSRAGSGRGVQQPENSDRSATKQELDELVDEMENHHKLLSNMLRPVYDGKGEVTFERGERRYIGNLLTNIGTLLARLKPMLSQWLTMQQRSNSSAE